MTPFVRSVVGALIGAVLSAVAVAATLLLTDADRAASSWPLVAVAAGAGAMGAWLAGAWLSRRSPSPPHAAPPVQEQREEAPTEPAAPPKKVRRRRRPSRRRFARISADWRWLRVSPRLAALLQRPADSLTGRSFLKVVHPEDVPQVDQAFQKLLQGQARVTVQFRLLTGTAATGAIATQGRNKPSDTAELPILDPRTTRHVRLLAVPRRDSAGGLRHYVFLFADITALARAEKALGQRTVALSMANERVKQRTQELERLKASYFELYHNAPVMYFSLDVEGRLVTFNDTLLRTLGYQREELTRRSYTELLATPALAHWEKHLRRAEKGQSAAHALSHDGELEILWKKKSGAVLNVWIRTVPVLDESGRFVRSRSAAIDLTERNRLANELRARGDELEKTNARLRAINSELEDFTHVVSHDLKEPLRTLQAYSNILAEDFSNQLGPDGFQYINHLINASRRLGTLIDDLLALGQAGRIKGAPQIFDLNEVVATVRNDLVGLIQRKEATVLTEGSLPTLAGDQQRITQLLTNLVANGLKYNHHPLPQVVIGQTTAPASAPDQLDPKHAVIYVRDNGIGIDPRYHQQIFGIFRRLHKQDEFEGTGAGLAICRKIVQGHGGRIWVESEPGNGATFYFTLPRPPGSASRNGHVAHKSVATKAAAATTVSKPHIVLVEDMPEVGMIIQRLAKKSDQIVTHFTTAEEAWEYLKDSEPELILLDINLPGMNGIELCKKIRGELGRVAVPIVLFSPDNSPEELARLHGAGASYVLSKDLLTRPPVWQHKVSEILREAKAATG